MERRVAVSVALLSWMTAWSGASAADQVIWEGSDGSLKTRITASDLTVTDTSATPPRLLLSLAAEARREIEDQKPDPADKDPQADSYYMNVSFVPLSLVGGVLSYETSVQAFTGGAHPNAYTGYSVIDLRRVAKEQAAGAAAGAKVKGAFDPAYTARLDKIFPPQTLLGALSADGYLKKHLKMAKFQSLADLLKTAPATDDDSCTFSWGDGAMESFAFVSDGKENVGVRIGLPYGCEVARGTLTKIGIELPVPPELKADLDGARDGTTGFLLDRSKSFKTAIGDSFGQ